MQMTSIKKPAHPETRKERMPMRCHGQVTGHDPLIPFQPSIEPGYPQPALRIHHCPACERCASILPGKWPIGYLSRKPGPGTGRLYRETTHRLYQAISWRVLPLVRRMCSGRGCCLWDLGLHFEVHEILEHAWHRAQGEEKLLLQAMIRAAGVYIKGDYGYFEAAAKLAARALPVLEAHKQRLAGTISILKGY